ncbi:MAG: hypothetical protein AB9866_10970 [Syntrophobacteraceae bacterium]
MSDAPYVLLPYQQAWIADTSPVKICEKSRRVGLSWCEAADDVLLAATEGQEGMNVWYIGYNKDMALEFINDCASWAKQFNKAASAIQEEIIEDIGKTVRNGIIEDERKQILSFVIRFDSGWRITALSSRPSNLRGKQGKVVIDEAAFHDDLAGLIKAAIALLMWGGRVCIISTHNGEANDFNELIGEIRAGKKPYSLHRIDLDQALEQGLYRRICLKLGRDWTPDGESKWRQDLIDFYGEGAEEELFCVPSMGSGVFLPRVIIEKCMSEEIQVLRWACSSEFAQEPEHKRIDAAERWCGEYLERFLRDLDPNRPCYFGEDFGRTGDLTVIVPAQEIQGLVYRAVFHVELRNVPFEQQKQVLFYIGDRLPGFRGGGLDARGNGAYLAEVAAQRYGESRIHQVQLTQEWYRNQMPKMKSAFEDQNIVIAKDADTLDDLRAVKMEKGIAKVPETYKGNRGRDGGQRHGDSAIAIAMLWYAITEIDTGPAEYASEDPEETPRMLGGNLRKLMRPADPGEDDDLDPDFDDSDRFAIRTIRRLVQPRT